ncbi:multidrug efflux pump subunit AcrB [Nitrosomonas sp. PY1]|uniref:efflux RND transporter permease subunit n=1 Tax=Nitrosomonas sp. PY1 TaxID=1803906 RepID=UPI001FC85921|nr:efflux RND transporter permease subunit [Nitrosomonas sp. PY1]GKS68908.1 multidrug efflux pump subunit AcrB [Nitrosomonas sp. PY1]
MNQIVLIALRRPYTFVVLAILIVLFGIKSVRTAPTDVFPNIKIPVIAVVWAYAGLLSNDVSGRITFYFERMLTSTVEGIDKIVSQSYFGISITNIFLQPETNLAGAEAEVTAISQAIVKALPPDISPPMIMRLEASSVPVAMVQVTSETLTPAELYNLAYTQIRPFLVTIPGAILPHPYGGKPKQLLVSLDQQKLMARQLSASDVHAAFDQQNLVLPAGDMKIKETDWMVKTNAMPIHVDDFNNIPIKRKDDAFIYLRDVADVQLAGPPQTNAVLVDGKQAVVLVVMKGGDASTLDVVDGIKKAMPRIEEILPPGVELKILNDASIFVKDSIFDVTREMLTAGILVGAIVMLLLGSWRPTVIVATSIPLSILTSLICLEALGESLNIMTLGGLALAVGILVDDATVMIENIDTHLAMGKPLEEAIVDAANQIVVPTLVATLCIVIVWFPLFWLTGVSGWLFTPMAKAVMLAMLASFILSRTLVPTMAKYILVHSDSHEDEHKQGGIFTRFQQGFEKRFNLFCSGYYALLEKVIEHRNRFVGSLLIVAIGSLVLFYFNGRDFFPEIKSDTMQMHMRAPLGTRIEVTSRLTSLVAKDIERLLPGKVEGIISNCGLPVGPHNLAFIPTPTVGAQDCDLTISLKDEKSPVWDYRKIIRQGLKELYPGIEFTFQPADLTAKILNFGSPAPIDVQVNGMDIYGNYEFSRKLVGELRKIPGSTDVVIQQTMRTPTLFVEGQRAFGLDVGSGVELKEKDIATNMLLSTSGSQQIDQKYWLDERTGISYQINIYTPQPQLASIKDLMTIPVNSGDIDSADRSIQLLGNLTELSAIGSPGLVTHKGIMPLFNIFVSAEGRGLGGVLADVEKIVHDMEKDLPRGSAVEISGQAETMRSAYSELVFGLVAAVVLIYLLLVVNFQSWLDPFIIITALPGALAGIAWSLFLTETNISVPALTGAIMSMGTATANSILVVSYARERIQEHGDALLAAIESGKARIRPVLMTASAMIFGMLPMATGDSTNAPLGRAVIGGLTFATIFTLFFVPCVYAMIYNKRTAPQREDS